MTSPAPAHPDPESRYRELVESLPVATYVARLDETSTIEYMSPQVEALLGYTPLECVGDPSFLPRTLHEDDRERVLAAFARTASQSVDVAIEYRQIAKDGRLVWLRDEGCVERDELGRPLRLRGCLVDITARKLAEAELVRTRALIDSIVESTPSALFVKDAVELRYVRVNRAYEELFGYGQADVEGKTDYDVFPEQADLFRAGDLEVLEGRKRVDIPVEPVDTASRGRRMLRTAKMPILGDAGEPLYVVGLCEDVTEVVETIEELERSRRELDHERQLLQALLDTSPDHIYFKDTGSAFIRISRALAQWLGLSDPSEAIGKTDFDFFAREHAEKARADELEVMRRNEALEGVLDRKVWPDGRETWVVSNRAPLRDDEGNVIGTYGVSRDVTDLKRAEQALQASQEQLLTLIANVPGAVYRCANDERYTMEFLSDEIEVITGYPASEFLGEHGRSIMEIIHPDDVEGVRRATEEAVAAGTPILLEYRLVDVAGDSRWVFDKGSVARDERGNVLWLDGVIFDITERRRAEEERDRMELDLRMSQKLESVGQLAAGIAHEINTPIQFVGDTVDFLRDCVQDLWSVIEEYRATLAAALAGEPLAELARRAQAKEEELDLEYLAERMPSAFERASDGVQRVASIVRAMKTFAHPDAGQAAAADLNEALRNTLVVARNEIKYVAEVEAEYGELPQVVCHIGDLNQVFLNLLVNAAQAIEDAFGGDAAEGYVKGTISVRTRAEGDSVVVSISDTGCGIPEEFQTRVFDPFFTTKTVGRGSGQGLAIARSIVVDKHGGELTLESEPGKGTTFHIRLPAAGRRDELELEAA